ncbi:fungal specific transcription factor [Colletotrichum truncatum]|uniref:Fungal specific transcription factor n=1 Tax=Colletotrichum truncatum TaxID=5467 RepID=A0ACC3YJT2_COLTU
MRPTSRTNNDINSQATILSAPQSPDATIDDRSETGSLRVGASQQSYVGGDHWAAILDSIADLKAHFDREEEAKLVEHQDSAVTAVEDEGSSEMDSSQRPRTMLLYGCRPARSRAEILSGLPPKSAVDRYISRYFNQLDLVASSSTHAPTFLREYEAFWADPSRPSIMWIGLLYSMICLAVIASDLTLSPESIEVEQQRLQLDLYREKVVQCLIMGKYTQGGPHALETFLNYVYIEFRIHPDADKDVWYLLGIEVNLAKQMGYHRDPKHFPHITRREGEMRRRVWATVLLSDCLISSQMGMPRMITSSQFDTEEPRNLNDTDLDGDISELPPARPETEHTTALGIIARRRMLIALGAVSDITSALQACSYAEVMKVDKILNEAGKSIPPPLQMKPMASSVTDSPQTIMSRLFLGHMFYKGQIMLHRKFLFLDSPSSQDDVFEYSRKACLHATLGTLKIQQVLDEETCPGGQLQMMHWRVGSIMNHHFLTATMILCSMVHRKKMLGCEEEIMTALRTSRLIWMRKESSSKEAKKAAQAVSIVLARAGGPRFDMGFTPEKPDNLRTEHAPFEQMSTFHRSNLEFDDHQGLEEDASVDQGMI